MTDQEFKQKIEERMEEIPQDLAEAIRNSNWEEEVFKIGRKYNLHIDDIGEVQNELILVLVGIVHPDEFRRILVEEIRIPVDKTDLIISDINTVVNEKIKNKLKQILDSRGDEEWQEEGADEDSEEELSSTEKNTMRSAGILLGGEEEVVSQEEEVEKEENIENKPIVSIATPAPASVVNQVPAAKPKDVEQPQVFKTKTISADQKDLPKDFLDPYREPIE